VLLVRELAIYGSLRFRYPTKQRPHFAPQESAEILQLIRLRGWTLKHAAERFVLHPNTIRNWQKALHDRHRADELIGALLWNKPHTGVRWLVQEIRTLCPEPEFGTRTITRYLLRAGIQISRTSVRHILEEPRNPYTIRESGSIYVKHAYKRTAPDHIYNPPYPNYVWHMDLTQL